VGTTLSTVIVAPPMTGKDFTSLGFHRSKLAGMRFGLVMFVQEAPPKSASVLVTAERSLERQLHQIERGRLPPACWVVSQCGAQIVFNLTSPRRRLKLF
jgi:hypothetical protein